MIAIIFDSETSGLTLPSIASKVNQPRITELGAVRTDGQTIISQLSQLIYPECLITEEITKITGITNDMLKGQPTFAQYLPKLKEFFNGADMMIAHNAPFDRVMLELELLRANCTDFPWPAEIICTAQEYATVFGFNPHMKELYQKIIGEPLDQKHRALDDVIDLWSVLVKDRFFEKIGVV